MGLSSKLNSAQHLKVLGPLNSTSPSCCSEAGGYIMSSQIFWWNRKNENAPYEGFTYCFKAGYNRPLRELKQIKGTIRHIHIWLALSLKCHPFGPIGIAVRKPTANRETWVSNSGKLSCRLSHYCLCLLDEITTASAKVSIHTGKATGKAYSALVNTTLPLKSVFY